MFLGVQKPKEKNIQAPLELSIIEALYLLKNGLVDVYAGNKKLSAEDLYRIGIERVEKFKELYVVYEDLRRRGFVVRRGLKFGCDYLVYRFGPGIDHAPFGVEVMSIDEEYDPISIVRMGRLLHSVRKKLIIAIVNGDNIRYALYSWWKP